MPDPVGHGNLPKIQLGLFVNKPCVIYQTLDYSLASLDPTKVNSKYCCHKRKNQNSLESRNSSHGLQLFCWEIPTRPRKKKKSANLKGKLEPKQSN